MAEKKRQTYLDVLRIIAIYCVYYVHSGSMAANYFMEDGGGVSKFASMCIYILSDMGPCLFFSISGALLLKKEETVKELLLKRVLKYVIIIVVFNVLQYLWNMIFVPEMKNNDHILNLKLFYSQGALTQYWFLYSYLLFLILLPILRPMAQNMKNGTFMYLFVCWYIIDFAAAFAEYPLGLGRIGISLTSLMHIVISPLLGYFVANRLNGEAFKKNKVLFVNLLFMVSFVADLAYLFFKYSRGNVAQTLPGGPVIYAVFVFYDIKWLSHYINAKAGLKKLLELFGSGIICAYLLEVQAEYLCKPIYNCLNDVLPWFVSVFVFFTLSITFAVILHLFYDFLKRGLKKLLQRKEEQICK